jgi:chromosome segregation protein
VDEYGESEIDSAALKSRQSELNRSLRGLGEVNLTAIEEHDEAKKRYDFYQEQQEDLLNAIDNLKEAILKINKESRERFSTTFTAVAAKFSEVIPMLFGGGKAQLSLTETNDILDAGVEIHIRPPGKKLQNMNLLSGGEKALAAIGLLFSIFLIKPSPFCLLDEVDAPLDDANIHRFNSLLEQIAATSQVILITHNKRTMEKADELYGVTMQEKGVSKLVSVRLSDIEDPAHAQA